MRYDIIRLGDEGEMVASRIKSRPKWLFSSMFVARIATTTGSTPSVTPVNAGAISSCHSKRYSLSYYSRLVKPPPRGKRLPFVESK